MIKTSEAFRDAIVGSPRAVLVRAVVDLSDPDMVTGAISWSPQAPWAKPDQLSGRNFDAPPRYGTLEQDYWRLDGSYSFFPRSYQVPGIICFCGNLLSGADGSFQAAQYIQRNVSEIGILQAVSVMFSDDPEDGVGKDITLTVTQQSGDTITHHVLNNDRDRLTIRGFTAHDVTAVRVTVTKWSKPYRRARIMLVWPGLLERWDGEDLESFTVTIQGQFSCLSLPYGSINLSMDNSDKRFEPRKKDSLFQSIEERQGVDISLGVVTGTGQPEYVPVGRYYMAGDGWKSSSNELTMSWYLVDMIGLLSNRTFFPPDTLPTTLAGWVKAVAGQLGENFKNRWHVDPNYAGIEIKADSIKTVRDKKCGDIIRWACQASGTWPRADQETGDLTVEPLWEEGNKYTLDNLNSYPAMKANEDMAALIFRLPFTTTDPETGEEKTEEVDYYVPGNSPSSDRTVTIVNPFIHTVAEALTAARLIINQYGGTLWELTGRGDPSSEIGDVDSIWVDESGALAARRISQTFQIQDGVLQGCKSSLLQAAGYYMSSDSVLLTESGTWTVPEGVNYLRVVIGQGGQGGTKGQSGWAGLTGNLGISGGSGYGDPGQDGQGGMVWSGFVAVQPGQAISVHIGAGGAASDRFGTPGAMGEHSSFGSYSSEDGEVYTNGYTDIANGRVFARTGVPEPAVGTGDGGKGGAGGEPGEGYIRTYTYTPSGAKPTVVNTRTEWVMTKPPGPGYPGKAGASGFVLLIWSAFADAE